VIARGDEVGAGAGCSRLHRATHRMRVSKDCSYDSTVAFTAAQLPGTGRLSFRTSFGGNRQLMAGPAPTLHALFG
jgi:hypothetical protein